jgi:hypothetical protein
MRTIGTIAVGLALVSGTSLAQAQTAVSRQITSEPVETVVTQGPNGTAVTRRILTPEPGVNVYAPPPDYAVAVPAVEPRYVAPVAPALAPRRTITEERVTTTSRRTPTVTRPAPARPARTVTRTVTRTVAAPVADQPLVLSPAERQVIYRTVVPREVVPREVYPAPIVAPPPVVASEVYGPRTVYLADDYYRDYAYDPGYRPDPSYRADPYYRDPYHPEYRSAAVSLTVGARIPPNVQLVAVPDPVVARVPAARPYSYARYGERVYLVDPATGIIVADITQ